MDRSEGPGGGSSDFLGDPPPDPRFLASIGALFLAELGHCCAVDILTAVAQVRTYVTRRALSSSSRSLGYGQARSRESIAEEGPSGPGLGAEGGWGGLVGWPATKAYEGKEEGHAKARVERA
jgi:hypothetical protein